MIETTDPMMIVGPNTSCSGLSHIPKNRRKIKVDCSSGITTMIGATATPAYTKHHILSRSTAATLPRNVLDRRSIIAMTAVAEPYETSPPKIAQEGPQDCSARRVMTGAVPYARAARNANKKPSATRGTNREV